MPGLAGSFFSRSTSTCTTAGATLATAACQAASSKESRQAAGATDCGPVSIRKRGYLPHWEAEGATYFVTYRLGDSFPDHVLESLKREREIYANAIKAKGEFSIEDEKRIKKIINDKVEEYLDSGEVACHLKNPAIAEIVCKNLLKFDGNKYRLLAWCIMPNHVHAVVTPLGEDTLSGILHSWKSYTSSRINRLLNSIVETKR